MIHPSWLLIVIILSELLAGPPFAWVLLNSEKFGLFTDEGKSECAENREEEATSARRAGWILLALWLGLVVILITFKLTGVLNTL